MSIEQAEAFIERLKSDEEFKSQLLDITAMEERIKARMKFINEAGYDCTEGEIQEVADRRGWEDAPPPKRALQGGVITCSHIKVH